MAAIDPVQLELLRMDEMDIALRLSHLKHLEDSSGMVLDDKEARKKEKRQLKDAKVCLPLIEHAVHDDI